MLRAQRNNRSSCAQLSSCRETQPQPCSENQSSAKTKTTASTPDHIVTPFQAEGSPVPNTRV
jgi:hypothetical protein